MDGKKWYFKKIFKSFGTVVTALFFASATLTLLVATNEFSILDRLRSSSALTFIQFSVLIFSCVTGTALVLNVKDEKLSIADSVYLAAIVSGLGFLLYLAAVGTADRTQLIACLALILFGGTLMIIRSRYFNDGKDAVMRSNKIKDYFGIIKDKYSVLSLSIISIVTVAVGYLGLNTDFFAPVISDTALLAGCAILIIPSVIYLIIGTVKKRVNTLDAVLLSGFISMPVLFLDVAILSYPTIKTCVVGSLILCWLVLSLIRYSRFDVFHTTKSPADGCNKKLSSYYKQISSVHGIWQAAAVAGLIALCALIAIKTSAVEKYILLFPNGEILSTSAIAAVLVCAAAPVILGTLSSLFSIARKGVCHSDFLLLACLFTAAFGALVYYFVPSTYCLYAVIGLGGYSLIMSIIRTCALKI